MQFFGVKDHAVYWWWTGIIVQIWRKERLRDSQCERQRFWEEEEDEEEKEEDDGDVVMAEVVIM